MALFTVFPEKCPGDTLTKDEIRSVILAIKGLAVGAANAAINTTIDNEEKRVQALANDLHEIKDTVFG